MKINGINIDVGSSGTSGSSGVDGSSGTSGFTPFIATYGVNVPNQTVDVDFDSGGNIQIIQVPYGTSGTSTPGLNGSDGSSGTSGLTINGNDGSSGTSGTSVSASGTLDFISKFNSGSTIGDTAYPIKEDNSGGLNGLLLGSFASVISKNQIAMSHGRFNSNGDAQTNEIILWNSGTGTISLYSDGTSQYLQMVNYNFSAMGIRGQLVIRDSSGTGLNRCAMIEFVTLIDCSSGSITINTPSIISSSDPGTIFSSISVVNSGGFNINLP